MADLSDTEVKALVAVSSRTLASAAAVGLRTPPARDTLTGPEEVTGMTEETGVVVVTGVGAGGAGVGVALGAAVEAEAGAGAGAAEPKVKAWFVSAALHAVWSTTLPLTVKHIPAAFLGARANGPAPPAKANN